VSPKHAKTIKDTHIYVKRACEGTVLVGTLSAKQPCIPLELTLGEHCVLTHDSVRRDVFFNGFCFTNPEPVTFEAKELWGMLLITHSDLSLLCCFASHCSFFYSHDLLEWPKPNNELLLGHNHSSCFVHIGCSSP
jgi:hypothetical protein